jgi:hypothetical protein
MVEFCGDQHGSRFIQQRLESGNEEDRALALGEIEPNIFALIMDVFGNYVIQKLFEVCDQSQKARLASKMEGNVVKLSLEMYGCRVGPSSSVSRICEGGELMVRWFKRRSSMF